MNDYERIARVIRYLDEHHVDQPDLDALARLLKLSPAHFHRLFVSWAGVTPKDFLQYLTLSHAKSLLRQGESVLGASLRSGLSGPGRLHDLQVTLEAATPGEWKSGGVGLQITYGFAATPFGTCLIAESPRGICFLAFCDGSKEGALDDLKDEWPDATLKRDDTSAARIASRIFTASRATSNLRLLVRGTEFQLKVWRALLQIPEGTLTSYGKLAEAVGTPGAARAVGTAVGSNPISFLIPCHRVIRETGVMGGYRWGLTRKRSIIAWESSVQRRPKLNLVTGIPIR